MTKPEPEIELIEDEEGMHLTLRGKFLTACIERASTQGLTVEQLIDRTLRNALADVRL